MENEAFLDTHVVVWLYAGELDRIPKKAKDVLESDRLLISPMAVLEIDYLFETKRISVKSAPIVKDLQEKISLQIATDPFIDIIHEASRLDFTRDPFDRLITAHAKLRHATLVTKDHHIRKHYLKSVW